MANKTRITTEGGPTLFDDLAPQDSAAKGQNGEPQPTRRGVHTATGDEWDDFAHMLKAVKKDASDAGFYILLPTETFARRGETYYNLHIEAIAEALGAANLDAAAIKAVTTDYARVTFGEFNLTADTDTMSKAMKALPPAKAASIDLYGLYYALMLNYARHVLALFSYQTDVAGEGATDETKKQFISRFYSPADAQAVVWLSRHGHISPSHFKGFDTGELAQFFARIREFASLSEYTTYYTFCKYGLIATPQELAEITPPPIKSQTSVVDYAERVSLDVYENLAQLTGKYTEAATSKPSTAKQAKAHEAATKWDVDTVKIHQNYGIVLSRPVNISPNGSQITNTLPVQRYIDDFTQRNPSFANITQMTVQKVVEGLNLLPTYLAGEMIQGDSGRLGFHTTITEFSEICGYADANQEQKRALLGGLHILDGLFFVVDRPKRYKERKTAKGTKKYVTGGRTAMRFLVIREIGEDTGELFIEIYPESLQGRPTLITPDTYKQLRAEAKGLTQSRFNAQIATKSHKSELDLIDEVFGFADMLKYATPDELPKVKKYVQGHRGRERERLLRWFDEYSKAGIITNFKRVPSTTNKRDFVLSWACPDPSKLSPPPFDPDDLDAGKEPDEQ